MSNRRGQFGDQWVGLVIDSPRRETNTTAMGEILGNDAMVLLVRENDDTIRNIVSRGASGILTMLDEHSVRAGARLLQRLGRLSSIRRVVVLHDVSPETAAGLHASGAILLRDCPEIRDAMSRLVQQTNTLCRLSASGGREDKPIGHGLVGGDDFSPYSEDVA
ncbi:MAG: hypothetical protein JSS51_10920 [Planctomycetes bacterium]|nr:hypothetical protein [Planctomycetota bacterium]